MAPSLATLPGDQLLARLQALVRRGNAVEAELLAHLAEVDARKLYLEEGCNSMFAYCQRVLHFAEGVAYKRIQAARAARRHPEILAAVRSGELHLTGVSLLAPHLDPKNVADLLVACRHRSADEIRRLLADREPRPDVPASVRRMPTPSRPVAPAPATRPLLARAAPGPRARTAPAAPVSPAPPARTDPLGAERYHVQFTADRVSAGGRRCGTRDFLEFDHAEAWARTHGHSREAVTLRCHAHNQHRARQDFGERYMAQFGKQATRPAARGPGAPGGGRPRNQLDSDQVHRD